MVNRMADFHGGADSIKSIPYAKAVKVKKTAAVSIIKVLPQKRYKGLDQSNAQKTQAVSFFSKRRRVIILAGHAQASKKQKLTKRPVASKGV